MSEPIEVGFSWNDAESLWECGKAAGSVIACRLHWYDWLRGEDEYWSPRVFVQLGQTFTPQRSAQNGKRYRCTIGGRTGAIAPSWPTSGSVTDGGVTWVTIGAEDRLSSATVSADSGLTVAASGLDATETVVEITLSGGVSGRQHMVTVTVTTDAGLVDVLRFRVRVWP